MTLKPYLKNAVASSKQNFLISQAVMFVTLDFETQEYYPSHVLINYYRTLSLLKFSDTGKLTGAGFIRFVDPSSVEKVRKRRRNTIPNSP
jgi:hypothetical protein